MADLSPSTSYTTTSFSIEAPEVRTRWEQLCKHSPQSSPFSSIPYAESLVSHTEVSATLWFISDEDNDLAGVIIFNRQQGPFSRVVVPGFTPFTSFLFPANGLNSEPWMVLLNKLAATYDDLRFHLHPTIEDVRPLSWINWQSAPFYTYQINLIDYSLDMKAWSSSTKRNFNKHKTDYELKEGPEYLGKCIELCAAGYERNSRRFPLNPQALLNLARDMNSNQMVSTFIVTPKGSAVPEAGIVVLRDETTAYYWIAGSKPGPAMTVLIGHVLASLKADGIQQFDFVGANTPHIAEFKRRFGATLVSYYAATTTPNRFLDSLLQTKRLFTR